MNRKLALVVMVLLVGLVFHTANVVGAEVVRLGGSSSAIGSMRLLADAFRKSHPDVVIEIVPNLSSGGGIKAVTTGAIDIGLSSRRLTRDESARGLIATAYGTSAFVIITGVDSQVTALTFADLAAVYSGERQEWPDGRRIRPILNPPADTDNEMLREMSPLMAGALDRAHARVGLTIVPTDAAMAEIVERVPGAIGTSTLSLVLSEGRKLKVLALNGIMPSPSTISDRSYPFTKTFYIVTKDRPSPQADSFRRFVRTPAGRAILTQNGHDVGAMSD